ncbi:hypothetical protein ACROYT_G041478 [Oculina patagonica]
MDGEQTQEERKSNVDNQNSSNEDTFLNMKKPWTIDRIEETITAKRLCLEEPKDSEDHIERVFKVNKKLKELADTTTENTEFLQNLADKVEDFGVKLLDQVHTKEEASICDDRADRYGSLFSETTKKAIIYGQKKFVSHPFLFKRVKRRWQRGSPFKSAGVVVFLLWLLLIMSETIFTPFFLPVIAFVSYRDQTKRARKKKSEKSQEVGKDNENLDITSEDARQTKDNSVVTAKEKAQTSEKSKMKTDGENKSKDIWDRYFDYINTPVVIFIKTEFMKVIFIALHCRICILGSTVLPSIEEYMVFLFFMAVMLSEYEQWRTSKREIRNTVYFKDMWNWIDLLTMAIYIVILFLRVIIILRGGDPFQNRLLEIVNYCYGFNTMFLILRLSSVLELSAVFGPLQLALFKMVVDLMIILVQFAFVIAAFSVALAKIYSAEMSYLMPSDNQTANSVAGYEPYCTQGAFKCLYKAARQLVWSVFGLMEVTDLQSHTGLTSEIVGFLYLIFLILSVIILVNILVALLTNTYEKYKTNWEVEWKFGLAVVEEQYARRHAVVIPYNILTYPILQCYFAVNKDTRHEHAKERKEKYDKYIRERFIPITTERYLKRYEGLFPLSVDEKLDNLHEEVKTLKEMNTKVDTKLEEILTELKKKLDSGGQSAQTYGEATSIGKEQTIIQTKNDDHSPDESQKKDEVDQWQI